MSEATSAARLTRSQVALLGAAYERLGQLMQNERTSVDELAAAAWACGLRLEFRLVPNPTPEPCQHVWAYSLGEPTEHCVLCGTHCAVDCTQEST